MRPINTWIHKEVLVSPVLCFDSHYHAYVISVSSHQSLISDLFDYNVYHGHKLTDGLTYIYLRHFVM